MAKLDWNRAKPSRGRFKVNTMNAASIRSARKRLRSGSRTSKGRTS